VEKAEVIPGALPEVLARPVGVGADPAGDEGVRPVGPGFADQPGAAAESPGESIDAVEMVGDDPNMIGIPSGGGLESSREPGAWPRPSPLAGTARAAITLNAPAGAPATDPA
jgi:hypothetical protein